MPASQLFTAANGGSSKGASQAAHAGGDQPIFCHLLSPLPSLPPSQPLPPPPPLQVFTTGTAVVLSPVGSLTYQGERRQYGEPGQPGPVALELYEQLTGLQQEKLEDPFGWVHPVC
jgi:hypothetical protein